MSRDVTNVAASVHARLKNEARSTGRPFNELLQYYAMERFLYRLSQSPYAEKFVLKGALLLRVHQGAMARPTRDIDLSGRGDSSSDHLINVVRGCCKVDVPDDGIEFDAERVSSSDIRPDAPYDGIRITVKGNLGTARLSVQVDVGFGDAIVPEPLWVEYPELLDFGRPRLKAYTIESAIAEKYQAMVELGAMNSRMKDYYDIWWLSQHKAFDGEQLARAIEATFERRDTDLPSNIPIGLTDAFADESKRQQWRAFIRRGRLGNGIPGLPEVVKSVRAFLISSTRILIDGTDGRRYWPPGVPG